MNQDDEQTLWDNARKQGGLEGGEHSTVPFLPASQGPISPYEDLTVAFPQSFQPPQSPYGQGQGTLPPPSGGYPDASQGPMYLGASPIIPPPPVASALKPKKPSVNKLLIAGIVVVLLLVLGLGGFLLLPALAASSHPQASEPSTPVAVSTPAAKSANPAGKNVEAPFLIQYRASIHDQIAQGLHLTPDQLNTQLVAGKTLSAIATAQGLSATQLEKLVTDSFQTAFQPAIDSGSLTQKQVDALVKRMLKQPKALDRYLAVRVAKNAHNKATPTAVAH